MSDYLYLRQEPAPGMRVLMFKGDLITFVLNLPVKKEGKAWLRTNIGHAKIKRKEIISNVNDDESIFCRDWFDIPMKSRDSKTFFITLALSEVGHFEAKCYFLEKDAKIPVWPKGLNTVINVEPSDTCCANIIYNAFVRQFGANKSGRRKIDKKDILYIRDLDKKGYTVIPASGTFRDLKKELDFIIGTLGCCYILLLPIHPTPTTYGKMGRFGSPYASLSFTMVDPALAEFDSHATPLEQFVELIDGVHVRGGKILMDIAINHTGWAAELHADHPEWLLREKDGRIEMPGAWGVLWADLTKLDYDKKEIWQYMAKIFLIWCERGVDGFRCDAGYMIPVDTWKYIIAEVREQYPDTIFLLEGLGGDIYVTRKLLSDANFNWAYSELFQNYNRDQIEHYLPLALNISKAEGQMINFAETHDNNRLASLSIEYAKMRTAVSALFSDRGGFGFANGVEWFAREKIVVHQSNSLNWGSNENQVDYITRLNHLLCVHPAFFDKTKINLVQKQEGEYIVLLRHNVSTDKKVIVLVNLSDNDSVQCRWNPDYVNMRGPVFTDLLTGTSVPVTVTGRHYSLQLAPFQVFCLTDDKDDLKLLEECKNRSVFFSKHIEHQRMRAKVLDIKVFYQGVCDIDDFDVDCAAEKLYSDPAMFCKEINHNSLEDRVVKWRWPDDKLRHVMIPPKHFIMVEADCFFHAKIVDKEKCIRTERAAEKKDGSFFVLFIPVDVPKRHKICNLKLTVFEFSPAVKYNREIIFLSLWENAEVKKCFSKKDLESTDLGYLGTNSMGGMLFANVLWGSLKSRYEALLAANMSHDFPEDRWIMFSRCRGWVLYQGYYQKIHDSRCIKSFTFNYNSYGIWQYSVPAGQGESVNLRVGIKMLAGKNALRIDFFRALSDNVPGLMTDCQSIRLVLRPDIENRNFHDVTKAYLGPENIFPGSINLFENGFLFEPDKKHTLKIMVSSGKFVSEPEWKYQIFRENEAERGLDPDSDLFSPGYFAIDIKGGELITLFAQIAKGGEQLLECDEFGSDCSRELDEDCNVSKTMKIEDAMACALDQYIVLRDGLNTIIAGYPWFLDWGRDTFIVVRSLIALEKFDSAKQILEKFAKFEINGTIPNMICGSDTSNRNTSDAPLWFIICCMDFVNKQSSSDFLFLKIGERTLSEIIVDMGHAVLSGMDNGIKLDMESGLIFSPAHFTWMDTNRPACTKRQGYPVEIQSMWYAVLGFLAKIDTQEQETNLWADLKLKVKLSVNKLFWNDKKGYLSDCIHADYNVSAAKGQKDDALRPNQLFAITMGVVTDKKMCEAILDSCKSLLVPGAIRSIGNGYVDYPLKVEHNGNILNNPHYPYCGVYMGDEDTKRKLAYHNGTAWTWVFPSFCEAWVMVFGKDGVETALSWLSSSSILINKGAAGHVPEIVDGDFPHTHRGCFAQAWGVSELLRVYTKIRKV